jgi:hypothetical protein
MLVYRKLFPRFIVIRSSFVILSAKRIRKKLSMVQSRLYWDANGGLKRTRMETKAAKTSTCPFSSR